MIKMFEENIYFKSNEKISLSQIAIEIETHKK